MTIASLLGIRLTLLAGKKVPVPPPRAITEAISKVEVKHQDGGRSAFQITFHAGQNRHSLVDYPLLKSEQFKENSRAIVIVTLGVIPQVLIDGIITTQQLNPSQQPGSTTITLTGEGIVSYLMSRKDKTSIAHSDKETDYNRAGKIIGKYTQSCGLSPMMPSSPSKQTRRKEIQGTTDWDYLDC